MKTAMILAAGRGERLKPITAHIPKALCKVKGTPLIEHHVKNLAKAGFEHIVINHAYLGGLIRQHLGGGSQWGVTISYSPEPPGGLETQGGILQALPLLGDEPFITVNADIFTDFDFNQLLHFKTECAHLVLVNKNSALKHHGDFGLLDTQVTNDNKLFTWAGISCYHPNIFAHCKLGRYSITPYIRQLIDEHQVSAQLHRGHWFDIGTQERLSAANAS